MKRNATFPLRYTEACIVFVVLYVNYILCNMYRQEMHDVIINWIIVAMELGDDQFGYGTQFFEALLKIIPCEGTEELY